jgi:hypothetical protein
MSCGVDRFIITKGVENTFVFTIKANGSTLPLEIENTDTFNFKLVRLSDDSVDLEGTFAVTNALSGQITLVLSIANTDTLEAQKGSKPDRYYLRPTYRLMLLCNTANNGNFIAKVHEVYVE